MLDWLEISAIAVGILSNFFEKAGGKIAEETGTKIFKLIQKMFKGDDEAKSTIKNFKKNPDRYKSALTEILRDKAIDDAAFGAALKSLVDEANQSKPTNNITQVATGTGIAQVSGDNSSASVNIKDSPRKKR